MRYEFWDVVSKQKIVVDRPVDRRNDIPTFGEVIIDSDIDMDEEEYNSAKWERVFEGGSGWTRGPNYGKGKKGEW